MSVAPTTDARTGLTGAARRAWAATHRFRPVLVILVVLFGYFSLTQPGFFDQANLTNMLTGISMLWVVAIGMTFVLISGGFDLSSGAVMALSGLVLAALLGHGVPAVLAVLLTVVVGALIGGGFNGVLIGGLNLSFFVVTLASMIGITGIVNIWSNAQTEFVSTSLIGTIGLGQILGVATPIWIMAITFLAGLYVLHRTYFGRDVYAVGGSRQAARLAGVRTGWTLIVVYGISGGAAAIAGVIAVGRIGAASPQIDQTIALNAAAAVLLGGTSIAGGAGGLGGTSLGVLFIAVMQNGLSIAGVQSYWQQVVTGVILVVAVLGDRVSDLWRRVAARRNTTPDVDDAPGVSPPAQPRVDAPDPAATPAPATFSVSHDTRSIR